MRIDKSNLANLPLPHHIQALRMVGTYKTNWKFYETLTYIKIYNALMINQLLIAVDAIVE